MNRVEMSNLYRGHSKDASYQGSIHFAKRFQRRRLFRNQPIRNKNGLVAAIFVRGLSSNSRGDTRYTFTDINISLFLLRRGTYDYKLLSY